MSEKNYISISEFAELKGITKQAVYKQLNKKLKEFVLVVENKKYIQIAALSEEEKNRLNEVEKPVKQQFNNPLQPFLENQIAEKDKTIEKLLQQIEVLQEKNDKLTERIQEQNDKLTDLLYNNQWLLAAEKHMQLTGDTNQKEEAPEEKKQGILKRLFSKKK